MTKRVAVIGAGVAGLAALRHLTSEGSMFTAVAYEQRENVGGVWVYNEGTENNDEGNPLYSPMYKNLKTNLPKDLMCFPGIPYNNQLPSHIQHEDVIQYLNDFADHYNLRQYIKFKTCVVRVHPVHMKSGQLWEVTTRKSPGKDQHLHVELFDAVMVCNGIFSVPHMPSIPGMDVYKGTICHSAYYRHPEPYAGKTVLCFGGGLSGMDISNDIATHAKHVYLSSRKPAPMDSIPSNLSRKPSIKSLGEDIITLENGEELRVDVLLLCTGYKYTFPFLTPDCGITVEEGRVHPVYKHILHPRLPSLSFIGLTQANCPIPVNDLQARFALAAIDGSMKLPTVEEMESDIEEDYQEKLTQGITQQHHHYLHYDQWKYCDTIADLAGVERIPPVLLKLFNHMLYLFESKGVASKQHDYNLDDGETVQQLLVPKPGVFPDNKY